ncbi:MAG TPA: tetratricopeptide repeat protein, partial [Anaerolineae bacterium]|nr:tetratricopeptide repeat protein [Anaerolineae bacterium]
PTSTPTPSPTPTPLPADLLDRGEEALFIGDVEGATLAFHTAFQVAPDDETAARALFGLGRTYLQDQAYGPAAEALRQLLDRFPNSPLTARAHFLLAEALVHAGDPLGAAEHYRAYLEAGTQIAPYLWEWIGDALRAGGDDERSTDAYRAALQAAPDISFEVGVREKLALAYTALEEYDTAIAQYDAILSEARIADYRARIAYQAAQTLLLAGRTDEGYDRHLEVVNTYPTSPWAYQSLLVLVEAGVEVDDLTRGIVDYYGGAYGPAVAALYRYIEANPDHLGEAHYYAAMAHLKAGSPSLAAEQFRVLVETHPESDRWGDGWMGWAQALAAQGDLDGAVETYRAFVEAAPGHPRAPEALWTAAQLLEGAGRLREAAQAYEDCQAAYPHSDYAGPALLRAGLQHYQRGAMAAAAADWSTLAEEYPDSPYRAAALLWLGKAYLTAGKPLSATAAFSSAVQADPLGYYGLRAADLLADPLAPPFPPAEYAPPTDPDAGRAEAEAWLADWLGLPSAEGLGDLDDGLASDPRLQRGLELWDLGRRDEAKAELETLRRATADDPLAQYRLALLFRDIGLYRSSILAAVRVIHLSPAETPLDAPPFLARLAYPTYYEDLIRSDALEEDLPPPLVFALVRQESLFEGFATSFAYAHGLMQVIPSTGASIAQALGWPPDYETADLYRPLVSVRFGTWYLARQRDRFGGRLDVALAAYNGGPGNAAHWLEAAGDDPDLFLERITLGETRLYLQRIREHYEMYVRLYGRRSSGSEPG